MRTIFSIFILFFSTPTFAGGFTGNGGDGIEIGGQLYVRDLVNIDLHKTPYIGNITDPELPSLPSQSSMNFEYPKELLARKLTDLNKACPSIGDYLLAVIKYHNWVTVDFPLTPITDDDDAIKLPKDAKNFQIASRLGNIIRIQKNAWDRLDDANKVALIIHEAVFSLSKLTKSSGPLFIQDARTAREITGQFFSANFLAKPTFMILKVLHQGLNVPEAIVPTKDARTYPTWKLSYRENTETLAVWKMQTTKDTTIEMVKDFLRKACTKMAQKKTPWATLTSEIQSRPAIIIPEQYTVIVEPRYLQTYFRVVALGAAEQFEYAFQSQQDCEQSFTGHTEELGSSTWW